MPQARLPMRTDPVSAAAIRNAGFHVVSFASNHCMDWGQEALLDTMEVLREQGFAVAGVGRNTDEGRKPAIIEKSGTRFAILAYHTILPMNYWAEKDRPGCAPMRGLTFYEPIEHDQPGTPPRIHAAPHQEDLAALERDIRLAKKMADIVLLSMHWGIHFVPAQIADYQREVAHRAIDCGADIILGHHPHILKGIEVYKGKAIFYSLGNFAIEQPGAFMDTLYQSQRLREIEPLNPYWDHKGPYSLPPDTRKSMIVKCVVSENRISKASFIPMQIETTSVSETLSVDDARFAEAVDYVQNISNDQGLNPEFTLSEEEVPLSTE